MDLLARLKTETRPHHDRIESAMNPMRPDLTRDEYIEMLKRMYGFYSAWEEAASGWFTGEQEAFFAARKKAELLEDDLRVLTGGDIDLQDLPRCQELPITECFAEVLGALYVLEGSTLGGQYIARHLQQKLGVTPESGSRFFASYGHQVGSMWRETQGFLTTHGHGHEDDVVTAAAQTFERLQRWMTTPQPQLCTV